MGSPALSVIQGHQLARRLLFSRGFSVILDRRRAVFIENAGEPLFVTISSEQSVTLYAITRTADRAVLRRCRGASGPLSGGRRSVR